MKVGLIARCDDRGLGNMTWEFYRHVKPERTLVVREPVAERQGFVQHPERYDDATVVEWFEREFDEAVVRPWLSGLDVVYSAETFYDERFVEWCRELNVRTVLHAMPEFYKPELLPPDVVWTPTSWRLSTLPAGARVVPVPVAAERFKPVMRERANVFLHVVGHRAALDRAGTTTFLRALRHVRTALNVRIVTQDDNGPRLRNGGSRHHIEYVTRSALDYWQLYDNADVLVAPRRYGGLSLPWNEACAAGLALVLPDVEPNRSWPSLLVPAVEHGYLRTSGGEVVVHDVTPLDLAAKLDLLAAQPERVSELSLQSMRWATNYSWESLLPLYRDELQRAAA